MPFLLVVRHGESEFNNSSKFCGWIDASLTERGQLQAKLIGDLIKSHDLTSNLDFNLMVTSRLKRAIMTSDIILEDLDRLDMDLWKTWRLNERHYGALQGQVKNDVLIKYGKDQFMHWRRAIDGKPPPADALSDSYRDTIKIGKFDDDLTILPTSESLIDVITRFKPFYESTILKNLHSGKNVIMVTHGSVIRGLLKMLFSLQNDKVENLNIPNGIPILIEFKDNFHPIDWKYLDPQRAKIESEIVKNDGLTPSTDH